MPNVVMPQPGQSVTEGTVVKWLKQVGDHVAADEILVEVETEKVNVEVPSPFEGTLTEILVQEGETVPVGAELATVGAAEEQGGREVSPERSPATTLAATAEAVEMTDGEQPPVSRPAEAGVAGSAGEVTPMTRIRPEANGAAAAAPAVGGAARFSPAVLRLAAEHNLDLTAIPGTGMGGRITRKDVVEFLQRGEQASAPPAVVSVAAAAPTPAAPVEVGQPPKQEQQTGDGATVSPAPTLGRSVSPAEPAVAAAVEAGEDEQIVRPSATRLTIARNMLRSAQTIPAAWMVVEADVTGLVRLRERQKEAFRQREGVDLSYLPFIAQAVTAALKEHPMLNSEWRDEQIVLKRRINLGIAVGAGDGLIVPVLHDADRLSVTGLAHAIADLAARARARRLRIEDVTGGTFTLDNTGSFGSVVSQPIVNPPQAAILSTEAIVKRPVVHDDAIAVRSVMNLCIAFDHRIVDGTHVGPFMQTIKRRLEALTGDTPLA